MFEEVGRGASHIVFGANPVQAAWANKIAVDVKGAVDAWAAARVTVDNSHHAGVGITSSRQLTHLRPGFQLSAVRTSTALRWDHHPATFPTTPTPTPRENDAFISSPVRNSALSESSATDKAPLGTYREMNASFSRVGVDG